MTAEFKDTVRVSSPGLRLLFGVLAPLSRLFGYRRMIRSYIEKFEAADDERAASSNSFSRGLILGRLKYLLERDEKG